MSAPSMPLTRRRYAKEVAAQVIGDDEAAIRSQRDAGRAAPAFARGILPPGDEVRGGHRLAVLEIDTQQLGSGRWFAVPGTMLRHDEITVEILWRVPIEKRHPERRGMRLDTDRRRG